MTDKNPAEKSGFDFSCGFVLAEELGDSARHQSANLYTFSKNNDLQNRSEF
ncbi:hypothetical protein [Bacillus sp. UMB0893]|uniref:hypothetical protein n=1 Tax=Bacillus sp. UMB0893 TaxID=2066053 RepID=UPI001C60C9C9|nr:hypothetical protein [Bacillus sp. UMB0893]